MGPLAGVDLLPLWDGNVDYVGGHMSRYMCGNAAP